MLHPFDYPLIATVSGINVHAMPDYTYFITNGFRSCRVSVRGSGFLWVEPWLPLEVHTAIENAILNYELKGK